MAAPCCTPVGSSLSRPGHGQDSQHLRPMRQRGRGRCRRLQRSNQAALERTAGPETSASRILEPDWVQHSHSCYRPSHPQQSASSESNSDWLGGMETARMSAAAATAHACHPRSWHHRMLSPWRWPQYCQGERLPRHHPVPRAPGCPSTSHQKHAAVLVKHMPCVPPGPQLPCHQAQRRHAGDLHQSARWARYVGQRRAQIQMPEVHPA
jgi:hypothetical protein